jgi:hypothetical protein
MAFPFDPMPSMPAVGITEAVSPLSKRRKFTPPAGFGLPSVIACIDNTDIENHTFASPLLPQLSSQAPTPEEIEASLLQVGMRIRKSVNDGYQNTPQKKSFTPRPFANNLSRLSPETQRALLSGNVTEAAAPRPFGATDVGNGSSMSIQPLATATFCGINLAALSWSGDDWSNPSVAEQNLWSYSTSHKRNYDADSDSDESQDWLPHTPALAPYNASGMGMPMDYFNIGGDDGMSDVSPMTQIGDHQAHGRKVAKPRSRLLRQPMVSNAQMDFQMPPSSGINPFASINMEMMQESQPEALFCTEQQMVEQQLPSHVPMGHRRILSCGMEASMDFGEAPFLQRREDTEMDFS